MASSTASIGGLASGLDTKSIIDQLMTLEAASQTRLRIRQASEQSLVTTLQTLNTKTALLASKAADLAKASTWQAVTATSSSTAVSVSTTGAAAATQLSVTVRSVALSQRVGFADAAQLDTVVTGASTTVKITRPDGSSLPIDTVDGTLQGLVTAINDPVNATGLRATTVKDATGYRLLVESATTGAGQVFDLTAADGSALLGGTVGRVRAGADATLDLGSGITVTSPTNTFADLVPGVSLTLSPDAVDGATATIQVAPDGGKLAASVTDLVASMNALLTEIDTQTAFNGTSKASGPLAGDAGVRNLRSAVFSAVFGADGKSLADVGIQTDRFGKIVFDATKLTAAYTADPVATAARFTTGATSGENGFAARLEVVAMAASESTTGTLTAAITGRRSSIDRLQVDIDGWDVRLQTRRESLERQYTALETALQQMQSQSSWLTSQIASLPTTSS